MEGPIDERYCPEISEFTVSADFQRPVLKAIRTAKEGNAVGTDAVFVEAYQMLP